MHIGSAFNNFNVRSFLSSLYMNLGPSANLNNVIKKNRPSRIVETLSDVLPDMESLYSQHMDIESMELDLMDRPDPTESKSSDKDNQINENSDDFF